MIRRLVAAAAIATAFSAALIAPAGAVAAAAPGGQIIEAKETLSLNVRRVNPAAPTQVSNSSFSGTLTWGDAGAYTITGTIGPSCNAGSPRMTTWLEYGSTSESWKESPETECTGGSPPGAVGVDATGTVRSGEQLEIRLATWKGSDFPVIYAYSDRLRFTPPGA